MTATTILPEGGRDFLRRRLMELVGAAIAAVGVALLMAVFTFSISDPSLNHATGTPPNNLLGLPGAYVSDLLLQTFGLAIVLVPVALITWGVRLLRTHHLGFFGLRLSLLLLALLMMSVACVGLGDVGGAATHAGPGGLVGLALVGRFREIVLTHSSGGSLALIEPACAALAFIAMAPALGMNRTDLPLIFRILRAPFVWGTWLFAAGVGLWRGRPQAFDENEPPAPEIGYAEIPGEIDASQYDPAHFASGRFEPIPIEGAPLPPRDSLLVDAPHSPLERPAPEIPPAPMPLHPATPPSPEPAVASVIERTLFDRLAGSFRIEPVLGRLRPVPSRGHSSARSPSSPPRTRTSTRIRSRQTTCRMICRRRRRPASRSCRASRRRRRASAPQGPVSTSSTSASASISCRRSICCRCPRAWRPRPGSTRRRSSRMPACSKPCWRTSASRARS